MAKSNKNNKKKASGKSSRSAQGQGTRMKNKKSSNKEIFAVILFAACVLLFLCFIGQVGIVGEVICSVVFGIVGQVSAYLLLAFFVYKSWNLLRGNSDKPGVRQTFFFMLLILMVSALVHTMVFTYTAEDGYLAGIGELLKSYQKGVSGGILGGSLSFVLQKYMTKVGAYVVLIPIIIVLAMCLFSLSIAGMIRRLTNAGSKAGAGIKRIKNRFDEEGVQAAEKREAKEKEYMQQLPLEMDGLVDTRADSLAKPVSPNKKEKTKSSKFSRFYDKMRPDEAEQPEERPIGEAQNQQEEHSAPDMPEEYPIDDSMTDFFDYEVINDASEQTEAVSEDTFAGLPGINFGQEDILPTEETEALDALADGIDGFRAPGADRNREAEDLDIQITPITVPEQQKPKPHRPYRKPPVSLLAKNPGRSTSPMAQKALMNQNAKKLESVLASFGIAAKVINISQGPSVTRYELQPNSGVKVSKIKNLSDDLALNLAATSIRIEAPIPGKAAIGIEIPNTEVDTVYFRDMIESEAFRNNKSKVSFCLGKNISGEAVVGDLVKMPHLLVAGTTGAGKSICINCLILSILYNASPDEVKLILIDPKQVEFVPYEGIPHLFVPVVKDSRKAAGALSWAVAQMNERYKMFSETGVRDIKGYNQHAEENGLEKLPQIVIIIDELADLMMVAHDTVEDSVCRLAQMARAAGMHLVIATQRPSVDVITGIIKANIPSRIALKVASQVDSRTIIDSAGAEKLLGRGDMIFMPLGSVKGTRIQGAFVSDGEVEAVVSFLKKNCEEGYDQELLDNFNTSLAAEAEKGNSSRGGGAEPGEDELLPKAIDIAVELKQISASFLQRKLGVGYNRAARLIDQMEERGIIGGKDGSNPRQVLVTRSDLDSRA